MKYNIMIADDHSMFLDGLVSILKTEDDYNIVLTAKTGKEVVKFLSINKDIVIDLVITDISMPEMDGIELNAFLKKNNKHIKTLVVSMHSVPDMIDRLIENEVDGYMNKNTRKEEFLTAVKMILNGEKYFSKEITSVYMKNKFQQKTVNNVKLTKREVQVVTLIAEEFTTIEIADKLFLSKHTIESYRKNLIIKLDVRNLAGLTKYALKKGYVD